MGNPRENAVGDIQGQLQQIIDNSSINTGRYDPIHNIWTYFTHAPSLNDVSGYLMGNQQRAVGQAGRLATATANAYGMNPYAAQQHAASNIYSQYANIFGQLPLEVSRMQLAANQGNFSNLDRLLSLKAGLAGQREGSPMGGLIGGLGSLGGSYLGGMGLGAGLGSVGGAAAGSAVGAAPGLMGIA